MHQPEEVPLKLVAITKAEFMEHIRLLMEQAPIDYVLVDYDMFGKFLKFTDDSGNTVGCLGEVFGLGFHKQSVNQAIMEFMEEDDNGYYMLQFHEIPEEDTAEMVKVLENSEGIRIGSEPFTSVEEGIGIELPDDY